MKRALASMLDAVMVLYGLGVLLQLAVLAFTVESLWFRLLCAVGAVVLAVALGALALRWRRRRRASSG